MARRDAAKISFTAHYTGHVWQRHNLAPQAWRTTQGRVLFATLQPLMRTMASLGGMTLEPMLLARHLTIDRLLTDAIDAGRAGQVLEIAAGRSGRGLRMMQRYANRELRYIETDLAPMAKAKAALLHKAGADPDRHRAVALDAFASSGPESLDAVWARELDPTRPTAIVTEGLVNYFTTAAVVDLWHRLATVLKTNGGTYLSDIHLSLDDQPAAVLAKVFRRGLDMATRGKSHMHFGNDRRAEAALREAGFDRARLWAPRELELLPALPPSPALRLVRVVAADVDGNRT